MTMCLCMCVKLHMRESMGISENLCKSHTWKVATCEQECHGRSVREIVFVRV